MKRSISFLDREYFTTYDIARLLELAPRTITRLIDKGHLKASRMPKDTPMGGNRRVHRDDLLEFLEVEGYRKAIQMITPPRNANRKALFLGSFQQVFLDRIEASLPDDWQLFVCLHPIEAGVIWQEHHPQVVVIDFSIGNWLAHTTAQWLHRQKEPPYLLGMPVQSDEGWMTSGKELKGYGWNLIYHHPLHAETIAGVLVSESTEFLEKGATNGSVPIRAI